MTPAPSVNPNQIRSWNIPSSAVLWSYVGPTLPAPTNEGELAIQTGPPDVAFVCLQGSAGLMWVQFAAAP
jgi:hypothetical protein